MIKRMFELSLTEKEAKKMKKIMAVFMLPIMVFYMTSMNFLAAEMMRATAQDTVVTTDPPASESSATEKKDEPAKEDSKTEPKKEEAKTPETSAKTENTIINTPSVTENKTTSTIDDKKNEVKETTWVIDGKTATISPAELGKTYKAPQNDKVTVTFSKLPEKAGSLTIKEIKLSSEEQATLGALTDTAYDITSDMKNGTFEYDLTLPYPEKKNNEKVKADDVQVLYTEKDEIKKEDLKNVDEDQNVDKNANDSKKVMEIKGLDHFTIFVVGWNFDDQNATADQGIAMNSAKTISVTGTNDPIFSSTGATTYSARADGWDGGSDTKYWQVEFASTGYSSLFLSSKQRSSSTGPRDFKVQYKLGSGGEWTDVSGGAVPSVNDNWISGVISNLALPTDCNNQSSVYLRWIMTSNVSVGGGTVSSSGASNIDDIIVSGTATTSNITNTNSGQTYTTIQAAIDAATAGDTINVTEGTYNETLSVTKDNLTIQAVEGDDPAIQPTASFSGIKRLIDIRGNNVTLKGFEIIGNGNLGFSGSYVGISISGQGVVVENNDIRDLLTGIQTTTQNSQGNVRISNNNVTHTYVGISLQNNNNTVENNTLSNISNEGMGIGNGDADENIIEGNDFDVNPNGANVKDYSSGIDMTEIVEKNDFERLVTVQDSEGNILGDTLYTTIQPAIDAANNGDTVSVGAGVYTEGQITINKDIALAGEDKETTIIHPVSDTAMPAGGTSEPGDGSGWFVISSGANPSISGLTFDGAGKNIGIGILSHGGGTISDNIITSIRYAKYRGFGIYLWNGTTDITNNTLSSIERVGIILKGSSSDAVISGNTCTGKGSGDWLDYGVELGAGAHATIENNTISNNVGVATDGSTSAGIIIVTTYYGAGTTATITGNTISNCTDGIADGYDGADSSSVTAHNNKFVNCTNGISSTHSATNATENWWGDQSGPSGQGNGVGSAVSENVNYSPWCLDENCSSMSDDVYSASDGETLSGTPQDINVGGLTINDITGTGNIFIAQYNNSGDVPNGGTAFGANGLYFNIDAPAETDFPIDIEISYSDNPADSNYLDENHFSSLYYQSGGTWHDYKLDDPASIVTIDKDLNIISASLQHLTPIVPVVDTTAPSVPTGGTPNGTFIPTNNFDFGWNDSTDDNAITYEFQSSLNPAESGGVLTTGLWHSGVLPTSMIHSSGAPDGTWYWQVRAVDSLGNVSTWSEIWNVTIDTYVPTKPVGLKFQSQDRTRDFACGTRVPLQVAIPNWDDVTGDPTFDHYEYTSFHPNGNIGLNEQVLSVSELNNSWMPPADGAYGYAVRSVDKAGNKSDWALSGKTLAGSCQIIYDSVAPTVHFVFPTPGSGATSFQAVFSEDVNPDEVTDLANYFLHNWPGAGGTGNLVGHATISYNSSSHTAIITFTTSGWYISPEQEWGVENIHDLAGNRQSVSPYTETSTPMLAPSAPGTPVSTPNPTNVFTQAWTWLISADPGGSGVKGYFWNIFNVTAGTYGGWSWVGNVLGVSTSLLDGEYQLQVKAQDNAGNESGEVNSATLVVDSIPPIITIDPYTTTPTNDDITVTASTNEGTLNTTSHTFTANGSFDFVATDDAGNTTTETVTITNIDKNAPVVSITAPVASSVSGIVDIRGSVSDDNPHHYWLAIYKKSNGQNVYSTTVNHSDEFTGRLLYSWNTVGLSDGVYQIKFAERDAADNRSADFVTEVTVDNTAPTATISYNPITWTNGSVVATLNPSEPVTVTNNSGNTTYTFTDNGTFTFEFVDAAGNTGSETATVNNIDKTFPEITNVAADKDYVRAGDTIVITAEVTDNTGISAVSADFSYNLGYTSRPTPTSVSMTRVSGNIFRTVYTVPSSWNDGVMYIKVAARDLTWANWIRSTSYDQVTVDNTVPVLDHKTEFSGWYNTVPQTSVFYYTDTNMADGYTAPTCNITTEGANQTCSATPNVCDKAGNCNTTTITSNGANIDLTRPESTITSPSDGEDGVVYLSEWDGSILGTAADALSGVAGVNLSIQRDIDDTIEYWNGSAWQSGETLVGASGTTSWNYTLTSLEEAAYTIKSHATDNAGNVENTFTLKIVLDKTIPTVSLSIDPADPDGDSDWYISTPEITLSANDKNLDRIEYQIDSTTGTWTVYTTPVKINDGKHTFYYRSIDKAGNISNIGVKSVKVDARNPDNIKDLDAEYDEDENAVKLSWNVDDSDVSEVYIYQGKSREFNVSSSSRIAINDDKDETYTDDDVRRGEKYYYKFVTKDEAGNASDNVKIISIRIPEEGGEAVVTDEGAETLPEETVLGEQSGETQEGQNPEANDGNNGQVAGNETAGENSSQLKNENWPYYVTGGVLILLAGLWWWRRRNRSGSLPID